jgi:tetratricopeptide (TPR) repeat protein
MNTGRRFPFHSSCLPGFLIVSHLCLSVFICGFISSTAHAAKLGPLEQMPIDAFAKLREVERYQMKVAEKYYLEENWKVALAEYEKYLRLYEKSVGAPYAQLMWSHCQRNQRQTNTAIKDGFQSVIDYWPDSHEAIVAKYMIGLCYKDMGEVAKAKKAYAKVITDHSADVTAVLAKVDLLDIARIENDDEGRLKLLKDLTFDTKRDDKAKEQHCARAANELAAYYYSQANHAEALKALQTNYKEGYELTRGVVNASAGAISNLSNNADTKAKGQKLADTIIKVVETDMPADVKDQKNKGRARESYYWIAGVHGRAGRPADVLKTYETMMKVFGKDDELLGQIATWYKGQKRRPDARRIYGMFENQVNGLNNIAAMDREENKYDDAIKVYQQLVQLDPTNVNRWTWEIGHCYRDSHRYKEAIDVYRQVDGFPTSYNDMAWCHRQLKQWNEAVVLYRQVMADAGSAPTALLNIAYTYEQAQKKENAIKSFQQVCKQFPKTGQASQAHAHLQTAYKISVTLGGAKEDPN